MISFNDHKKQATIPDGQVQLLLSITCICWLAAKLMGWKLWVTDRSFPVVPAFDFLYKVPGLWHWAFLIVSTVLLLTLIFKPGNQTCRYALLLVELFSCVLDENRWQPWEYLYLFILFIFIVNKKNTAAITSCFIILLATIYFYSGLHKFNGGFLTGIWENMVLKRFFKLSISAANKNLIHYCGIVLPLIESVSGIGLLFFKTKKTAATMLIAMHLFILILVGPFGLRYEKIVWPWNVAMIFFHYFIFLKNKETALHFSLLGLRNKIFLLCWSILPALNFIGWWDNFLSWNLYSAELPQMAVCIKDATIPAQLQPFLYKKDNLTICNGSAELNIQAWALEEMNVPACPEERTFKKIKKRWQRNFPSTNVDFIIYYFPFKPVLENH